MKKVLSICAVALMLCMTTIPAFAAEPELTGPGVLSHRRHPDRGRLRDPQNVRSGSHR